jgi:chorismate-pyruvate lyase
VTGDHPSDADRLAAALQNSTITVTEFLEDLAGEPIDALVLSQDTTLAGDDNALGLAADAELMRRAVFLAGRESERNFVYAQSAIAVRRIPASVRRRLEVSRDPIGRVLVTHDLSFQREPLAEPIVAEDVDGEVEALLREAVWSRRHRISVGDHPAMVVSEWFLPPTRDALAWQFRYMGSGDGG